MAAIGIQRIFLTRICICLLIGIASLRALPLAQDATIQRIWRHIEDRNPELVDFAEFGQRLSSIKKPSLLPDYRRPSATTLRPEAATAGSTTWSRSDTFSVSEEKNFDTHDVVLTSRIDSDTPASVSIEDIDTSGSESFPVLSIVDVEVSMVPRMNVANDTLVASTEEGSNVPVASDTTVWVSMVPSNVSVATTASATEPRVAETTEVLQQLLSTDNVGKTESKVSETMNVSADVSGSKELLPSNATVTTTTDAPATTTATTSTATATTSVVAKSLADDLEGKLVQSLDATATTTAPTATRTVTSTTTTTIGSVLQPSSLVPVVFQDEQLLSTDTTATSTTTTTTTPITTTTKATTTAATATTTSRSTVAKSKVVKITPTTAATTTTTSSTTATTSSEAFQDKEVPSSDTTAATMDATSTTSATTGTTTSMSATNSSSSTRSAKSSKLASSDTSSTEGATSATNASATPSTTITSTTTTTAATSATSTSRSSISSKLLTSDTAAIEDATSTIKSTTTPDAAITTKTTTSATSAISTSRSAKSSKLLSSDTLTTEDATSATPSTTTAAPSTTPATTTTTTSATSTSRSAKSSKLLTSDTLATEDATPSTTPSTTTATSTTTTTTTTSATSTSRSPKSSKLLTSDTLATTDATYAPPSTPATTIATTTSTTTSRVVESSNTSQEKLPDSANVKLVLNAEILREQARLRYRSNATANYLNLLKTRILSKSSISPVNPAQSESTTTATTVATSSTTSATTETTEPAWRRRITSRRKISSSETYETTTVVPTPTTTVVEATTTATTVLGSDNDLEEVVATTFQSLELEESIILESSIAQPTTTTSTTTTPTTHETTTARPFSRSVYSTIVRSSRTRTRFVYNTESSVSPTTVARTPATTLLPPEIFTFSGPADNGRHSATPKIELDKKPTIPSSSRSLEDILQRLVPARDDNNPFLSPVSRINHVLPSNRNSLERSSTDLQNRSSDFSSSSTSLSESPDDKATTSLYIVGIVAVFPIAGVVLWIVRFRMTRKRNRLNESEASSETDLRKLRNLPPLPVTPSRQNKLTYGLNDKDNWIPARPSPWEYSRSRLRVQTLIGEGNFGQVWKAEAEDICGCEGTLLVAVKTVKDGATAKDKQELLREMKIMQQLGPHPNVVALLGCCTEQEPFFLIMEYVMYGRLLTFLRDHRSQQSYYNYSSDSEALTSRDLTMFAYCVAKGMEYISSKGIVHRDLAARNVLVDHNKMCKVADFGLSRSVRDSGGEMYEQRVKGALPIRWMAPESLIQSVFTQKSDVWSFGILMWEIVTLGSTPYPGMEAREVMRKVKEGHRLDRPNHCRTELFRLMSRCWSTEPARRPDFSELKAELARLLDDSHGYVDFDKFQDSVYLPLESPTDESEKI